MHILDILIAAFEELRDEVEVFTEADLEDMTWFEEGLADEAE